MQAATSQRSQDAVLALATDDRAVPAAGADGRVDRRGGLPDHRRTPHQGFPDRLGDAGQPCHRAAQCGDGTGAALPAGQGGLRVAEPPDGNAVRARSEPRNYLADPPADAARSPSRRCRFAYPAPPMQPNPEILKGIPLAIDPGERVAVLGRIGSGKSTLLRMMGRLYMPAQGAISLGGLAVEQIDPADWRRAVGYVGQDVRLFYGSLRQNVMIGRPDATARELLRVLKLTGLDEVAARHPRGVNLPIGEGGAGLSGGQRQLVSLARTLLGRPQLLLFDEPTSAMDTQTEEASSSRISLAPRKGRRWWWSRTGRRCWRWSSASWWSRMAGSWRMARKIRCWPRWKAEGNARFQRASCVRAV